MKKIASVLFIYAILMGTVFFAYAATFPSRPISVTNPFLPGGILDLCWRPVSEEMSKTLKQTIVNNIVSGAGGVIGISKFAQGKPGGYNILFCSDGTFIASSRLRKVRYNVDDYVSLGAFARTPNALACHKDETRWTDLKSFVEYAKAHPGELSIGQTGMMTQQHISTLMILDKLGIELKIVPFDGEMNTVAALSSKHIDLANASMLKNESIKVLGMLGDKCELYPNTPSFKDAGYDIYWATSLGLYVHKNTPIEDQKKLTEALIKGASAPFTKEHILSLSQIPVAFDADVANKAMSGIKQFIDAQIAAGKLTPEK